MATRQGGPRGPGGGEEERERTNRTEPQGTTKDPNTSQANESTSPTGGRTSEQKTNKQFEKCFMQNQFHATSILLASPDMINSQSCPLGFITMF